MDSNKWQNILIEWVNCLKLSKTITNIEDLKSVEFFQNLRNVLKQQQQQQLTDCDILTFIFNLFKKYYPQFSIVNSNEIHLFDLPKLDLIAITSLLMHYTCIYSKREILISPLCHFLPQTTQIIIKQFLEKIDDKITIETLNNYIKECVEPHIDDVSTSSSSSPLQDLLKTPKYHRLEQRRRDCIINDLCNDLELERHEKIEAQNELIILKELNKDLTKQLKLKNNEIIRLRDEIDVKTTTTTSQASKKQSQNDCKVYKIEIDCLNQYVKQLETEQKQLEKDRNYIDEKLKQCQSDALLYRKKSDEIERNFDLLTQQYEILENENKNLKDIVDQLQTLLDEYKIKENSTFECDSVMIQHQNNNNDNSNIQQCNSTDNLASVVVEVQLQEAIAQNDVLKEKIKQLEDDGEIFEQQLKDLQQYSQIKFLENQSLRQEVENTGKKLEEMEILRLKNNEFIDIIQKLETNLSTTKCQQFEQEQCYQLLEMKYNSIRDVLKDICNNFNGIKQENYNLKCKFQEFCYDFIETHNKQLNKEFQVLLLNLNEKEELLNVKIDENEKLMLESRELQQKNDELVDKIGKLESSFSDEKQELLHKIEELSIKHKQQLQHHKETLKSIWNDFHEIKHENCNLKIEFKEFCCDISSKLKDSCTIYNEHLKEKIDENDNLKRELNKLQQKNDELVDEIQEFEKNLSNERQELSATKKQQFIQEERYKLLESKYNSMGDALKDISNNFDGIKQENCNLKYKFQEFCYDFIETHNKQLNKEFQSLLLNLNEKEELLNCKIDENEKLMLESRELQQKNDELVDKIGKLEEGSIKDKQQLQHHRETLKTIWNDSNDIKHENCNLKIKFKAFCCDISSKLKDFSTIYNEQLKEKIDENDNLKHQLNESQLKNDKLFDEIQQSMRDLGELQLKNDELVDKIGKLESSSSDERQELLHKIEVLSIKDKQQLQHHRETLKSIWNDFSEIKHENCSLKMEFKEFCCDISTKLKDSCTIYNEQLKEKIDENDNLKHQLNESQQKNVKLVDEMQELMRDLNELQQKNHELVDEIHKFENCLKQTTNNQQFELNQLKSKHNFIIDKTKFICKDFNAIKQDNIDLRIEFKEFHNDIANNLKNFNVKLLNELHKITVEYDNVIYDKTNENEKLKLELNESQDLLMKLRNNLQDLTKNLIKSQENLAHSTTQLIDKDKQLNLLKNDYLELQRFSSTLTDDLKILTTDLNLENSKQQSLNEEKDKLLEQLRSMKLQLENSEKINKQLQEDDGKNRATIQEYKEKIEKFYKIEVSLKQKINNLEQQLNDKNQEIAQQQDDLIKLQQLQEDKQQLITQMDVNLLRLQQLEDEQNNFDQQRKQNELQLNELKQHYDESQLLIKKFDSGMEEILAKLSTETLNKDDDIDRKWQILQTKLLKMIDQHSQMIQQEMFDENQMIKNQEIIKSLEETVQDYEITISGLKKVIDNNFEEFTSIKNDNSLLQCEYEAIRNELFEIKNKHQEFQVIFDKLQTLLFGKIDDARNIDIIYNKIDEIYKNQQQLNEKSKTLKPLILNKENILPKSQMIDETLENEWKKKNMMLKQKLVLTENAKNNLEKKLKQIRDDNKKLLEQQQQQNVDEKMFEDLKNLRDAYGNIMSINSKLELENVTLRKLIDERNDQLSDITIIKENYERLLEENNKLKTETDTIKYKRLRDKDEYLRLLRKEREEAHNHEQKRIHDIRNEYENKLQRMKEKMLKLYQEEVSKETHRLKQLENNTLAKTVSDLRLELFEAEQKLHLLETERDMLKIQKDSDYNFYLHEPSSEQQQQQQHDDNRLSILPTTKASTLPRTIVEETIMTRRTSIMNSNSIGRNLEMEDEDQDLFNNKYLTDLKEGRCISSCDMNSGRMSELAWRNSLLPPHLKSSYPAEVQCISPSRFKEDDIKTGNLLEFETSLCKLLPGDKPRKKDFGTTSYKKPGPPTPSKNGGRLSLQGNEIQQQMKEKSGGTPKRSTPSRIKALFTNKTTAIKNETPTRGRRLSSIFKRPKQF